MWTPWGPGEVSCIERCPHFRGKFTLRKHNWDIVKYLNTEVSLFQECPLSFRRGSTVVCSPPSEGASQECMFSVIFLITDSSVCFLLQPRVQPARE